MSVLAKLVVIAPEFAAVENINEVIEIAELQIGQELCGGGDKRELIVAYLAAHILTLANRPLGATGDVRAIKEGGASLEYNSSSAKINSGLSLTSYGQECDRLARSCTFTARTRNANF